MEMISDLFTNIYNRIAQLGKEIQGLKGSLDELNKNIEQKITNVSEKMSEFKKEIEATQIKHIASINDIGGGVTKEIKRVQEGLGIQALDQLISNLEKFSKLAEEVLNQDVVNLLLSEALGSVKNLKELSTKGVSPDTSKEESTPKS